MPTWDAKQYLRFNDERTRPCRELAARIALAAPVRVIDLGCGPGNSTAVLAERWPMSELIGLDSSEDMITAARKSDSRRHWEVGEIAVWSDGNGQPYDVIFSNAAMQWVPNHAVILPKLLKRVAPGGALAIQMPGNFDAPAHRIMREMAASETWRSFFKIAVREWHVECLTVYHDILTAASAAMDLWETEYMHILPDAAAIVEWYKGTGLRPFLDALPTDGLREVFIAEYLERVERAYPRRGNGSVILPFRRLFIIAYRVR